MSCRSLKQRADWLKQIYADSNCYNDVWAWCNLSVKSKDKSITSVDLIRWVLMHVHVHKLSVYVCISLCPSVGLTKRDAQLTPSQKYLAIRYVTQVCFYCLRWMSSSNRAEMKKKSWIKVNELSLKEMMPFVLIKAPCFLLCGVTTLPPLSGSLWCCQAVVRHTVSTKPRFHHCHVTCIVGMPYPPSILHSSPRLLLLEIAVQLRL